MIVRIYPSLEVSLVLPLLGCLALSLSLAYFPIVGVLLWLFELVLSLSLVDAVDSLAVLLDSSRHEAFLIIP